MKFKLDDNGHPAEIYSVGVARSVAAGAASAQSAALTADVVRMTATVACFIVISADPTATSAGHYLPAGVPTLVRAGAGNKIAAIQASSAGTLYISELN